MQEVKMILYKGFVSTNKVGSESDFEFEMEEGATDDEIEQCARDAMFNLVEWSFARAE